MRDLAWSLPGPCYAGTGSAICACAGCEPLLPEWMKGQGHGEPDALEDAIDLMLSALFMHLENVAAWQRESRGEPALSERPRSERRAEQVLAWLVAQLDLGPHEVLALLEIRDAMVDSVPISEVDVTRSFVPEAWRALQLVAGDA